MCQRTTLLLLLLTLGCASSTPSEMAEQQALKNEVTDARMELQDFVAAFSNGVERAADLISQQSEDPEIKRNTVFFKMRSIPVVRRALQRADDQAVVMDFWLYASLVARFSASEAGREYFGEGSGLMEKAGEDLEQQATGIARRLMPKEKFESAKAGIEAYVSSHELEGDLGEVSHDATEDWGEVVTKTLNKPVEVLWKPISALNFTSGISDTAVAVHQAVAEIDRTRTLIGYLPTDIRWQAQLLLLQIEANLDLDSLIESFATVSQSAESIARTAESLPEELSYELTSFVEAVDDRQANLRSTLNEVDTVLSTTDQVARSLATTSESLTQTFQAFDAAMVTILGPPSDPTAPVPEKPEKAEAESEPFDIEEYGATAEKLTETANALTALLAEAKELTESPAGPALVEDTGTMARGIVDRAFLGAVLFVLFTAAVMLAYKVLVARIASRDSR